MRGVPLIVLGVLAACTQAPALPEMPPGPSDACRASAYQGLVGQDRKLADAMRLPPATRIIGPGSAVTADYRPDRLNVEYDAKDRITRISCY